MFSVLGILGIHNECRNPFDRPVTCDTVIMLPREFSFNLSLQVSIKTVDRQGRREDQVPSSCRISVCFEHVLPFADPSLIFLFPAFLHPADLKNPMT